MTILLLLVGLGLIVLGADWLVEGASSIARKAGVSEFVIGLLIVGFGTSCPELVVSLTGAVEGNADMAVGNVIGSNVFNGLFILGLTALLRPVSMTAANRREDIPLTLAITAMFLLLGMHHSLLRTPGRDLLSRTDGALFLLLFVAYVIHSFRREKLSAKERGGEAAGEVSGADAHGKVRPLSLAVLLLVAGLASLIFGGHLFVQKASELARMVGVSDKFIAVTVLAGGTSLPELATSLVAALKGKHQLALGNILGSNVFNLLLILGSSAVISPLSCASVTWVDAIVLLASVAMMLLWAWTGQRDRIDRWEGALMLVLFGSYYIYLFATI